MPTDDRDNYGQADDAQETAELSRLLRRAEPPRSPGHVDRAILDYARDRAPARAAAGSSYGWLFGRPWVSAVATLSIAVIAVSVTLQSVNEPTVERALDGQLADLGLASPALVESAPAQAPSAPASQALALEESAAQAPADAPQDALAEPARQDVALEPEVVLADADAGNRAEFREQVRERQAQPGLAQSNLAAPVPATSDDADSSLSVEALAIDSTTTGATAGASVAARRSVADSQDNRQDIMPVLLRFLEMVLDADGQNQQVERDSPQDERIAAIIADYEALLAQDRAAELDSRFETIRGTLADYELPESLATAIAYLRTLQN